jgi:hypothetical protein
MSAVQDMSQCISKYGKGLARQECFDSMHEIEASLGAIDLWLFHEALAKKML